MAMTKDDSRYLRERIDDAGLQELFPGFDKEAEWDRLSGKLKKNNYTFPARNWLRAAATILLLIGVGGFVWLQGGGSKRGNNSNQATVVVALQKNKPIDSSNRRTGKMEPKQKAAVLKLNHKKLHKRKEPDQFLAINSIKATEPICNATKCAIEICIYQTIHCLDGQPSEIADCRTIEPDQSGQINYKMAGSADKGCRVTIDEIRIKKVSTGETIVINSGTNPASADELFRCFTGEKKCNMLAGIFKTDCNNDNYPREVTIGSQYGDIIIH